MAAIAMHSIYPGLGGRRRKDMQAPRLPTRKSGGKAHGAPDLSRLERAAHLAPGGRESNFLHLAARLSVRNCKRGGRQGRSQP
ncbi:hypothetical protein RHSP_18022 [Rhizobium freirei PRF 81]|uniref:Uncharacterized protein n=1 Tax=Rhizobium freirei PRF 81 TaxID=363754 RepID=N6UYL0_9HYPH|nr:hypothetical protein RHSP_18022 [Rhizobium freirei PRF 81]